MDAKHFRKSKREETKSNFSIKGDVLKIDKI